MKNKSILSLLTFVMSAMLLTTSCEDMLTPDLERYASEKEFGKDSIYSALGVLRSIQNVAERTVLLGECRGDLVTDGVYTTDSIGNIINFGETENGSSVLLNVADFYHVINSCNFYLANVDTTVTQNNVKIMQREWAQVQAMRGWAYIQLVRLYGEVPFVTAPVMSTNEAEDMQKSAPKVNSANLADMLAEAGLTRALELQNALGMPDYGSFSGGGGTYSSQANLFPVQLVLGDAYLMKNDYANAATQYYNYYQFVKRENPSRIAGLVGAVAFKFSHDGVESKVVSSNDLHTSLTENGISVDEIVSAATGASTSANGRVLDVLQNVTGFYMEHGSLSAHEQNQQLIPSNQYISLSESQRFNSFEDDNGVFKREEYAGGDGRRYAWAPNVTFRNGNRSNIISKYAMPWRSIYIGSDIRYGSFRKNYQIPFYRNTMVLLRYAEAINRLGFPELAFGILKDGLFTENMPTIGNLDIAKEVTKLEKIMDTEADTLVRVDTIPAVLVGKVVNDGLSAKADYNHDSTSVVYATETDTLYVGDTIWVNPREGYPLTLSDIPESVQESWLGVEYMLDPRALSGGMYYLSQEERGNMAKYPFFDFSDASIWSLSSLSESYYLNYGVHARGCGDIAGIEDTVYTYARQVAEKVAEDYARTNSLSYEEQQAYAKTLYSGDTLLVTDKETIINAVENLIVDENALETAFEGHRFTDLIRFAEHKSNAGINGTDWLAWKIGRRNKNVTDPAAEVDKDLESKMKDKTNWYLPMP